MKTLAAIILLFLLNTITFSQEVIYHAHVYDQFEVVRKILKEALEVTEKEYGKVYLKERPLTPQGRQVKQVVNNKGLDLMWSMTSKSRESELLAVPIPILKGLIGLRIFIIHSSSKAIFKEELTLKELKKIKLGQAHDWPDTEILESNGLDIFKFPNYKASFRQLNRGRFIYYPRGVVEPYEEIKNHPNYSLTVETNHAFFYHAPFYFFVNKENERLASRIQKGLESLIATDRFNEIFYSDPVVRSSLEKARVDKRKIIHLNNPFLTEVTDLDRKELWIDLKNIEKLLKKYAPKN